MSESTDIVKLVVSYQADAADSTLSVPPPVVRLQVAAVGKLNLTGG